MREPRPREVAQHRFLLLKLLIVGLFAVLVLQLARIQIVDHAAYDARAESNRLRTIPLLPARGLIYDRYGELLVENLPIYSAAVVPADVPAEQFLTVVAGLAEITGEPPMEIALTIAEAQESADPFSPVVVKLNIDEETAFLLRERQPSLPGAQVLVQSIRSYPEAGLLAHLLGYVGRIDTEEYASLQADGYQLNDRLGKAGVELIYEAVLRGSPGYRQVEIDAAGEEINTIATRPPRPAASLRLSLDLDLQRKVEQFLIGAMGDSLNAVAIVMDVNTGGILSMVSLPSYDNNILTDPVD
ncbi:MAG: penicillin-binding protein 2, partial [Chloroflexi bacterium]|nr:penicillin-binding protein 2 [Chloroflexota bacterium]